MEFPPFKPVPPTPDRAWLNSPQPAPPVQTAIISFLDYYLLISSFGIPSPLHSLLYTQQSERSFWNKALIHLKPYNDFPCRGSEKPESLPWVPGLTEWRCYLSDLSPPVLLQVHSTPATPGSLSFLEYQKLSCLRVFVCALPSSIFILLRYPCGSLPQIPSGSCPSITLWHMLSWKPHLKYLPLHPIHLLFFIKLTTWPIFFYWVIVDI